MCGSSEMLAARCDDGSGFGGEAPVKRGFSSRNDLAVLTDNCSTDRYHFAEIVPHYVVRGDRHIDPNEEIIDEIWFVLDDATTLCCEFNAFGFRRAGGCRSIADAIRCDPQ